MADADAATHQACCDKQRVTIAPSSGNPDAKRVFKLNGQETLLFGGNYVLKAKPYFPPPEQVSTDAKKLANELDQMPYKPPRTKDDCERTIVPCVRLGAMMEGSMPQKDSGIDATWAANLEATLEAFAEQGVYVILDVHMDAYCATNGGDGLPWWMAAEMQESANCWTPQGQCHFCCCCCGTPNPSYLTSPDHPLEVSLPSCITKCLGISQIRTVPGDKNPWKAFSVGNEDGNPGWMNVGNKNMRMNNSDKGWEQGIIGSTRQVHNFAPRFYLSPYNSRDRQYLFQPYLEHVQFLCRQWEKHWNVVAVELLNEPFLAGLPNIYRILRSRRDLFNLHLEILKGLEQANPPIQTPIAIQDGYGSLSGASILSKVLSLIPITQAAQRKLKEWGKKNQLILSFHYYPGPVLSSPTTMEFDDYIAKAHKQSADVMGNAPLFLSEFWGESAEDEAQRMAQAANLGVDAITYWQYADHTFTGQPGWYMYPPKVTAYGLPITSEGELNPDSWEEYVKTVYDGTFWGAMVCGAAGSQEDVLALIPDGKPSPMSYYGNQSRRVCCCWV